MKEHSAGPGSMAGKPANQRFAALRGFRYDNGYTLQATDMGSLGVKIELLQDHDTGGAIILPPKLVGECGRWMLQTLGQDRHGLPEELPDILKRLSRQKAATRLLKRGDKKIIKDALKTLRSP